VVVGLIWLWLLDPNDRHHQRKLMRALGSADDTVSQGLPANRHA
jgi:hypothetical protein